MLKKDVADVPIGTGLVEEASAAGQRNPQAVEVRPPAPLLRPAGAKTNLRRTVIATPFAAHVPRVARQPVIVMPFTSRAASSPSTPDPRPLLFAVCPNGAGEHVGCVLCTHAAGP